jgi:hypothetical protein
VRVRSLWLTAVLVSLLTGCAGSAAAPAPPAAASAVERFLQLARQKDYVQMGWVFGTVDGPIIERDPRPEVERRMYGLAEVLASDSFTVGTGSPVPGRIGSAEAFRVRLRHGSLTRLVPVTTVLGRDRRWFVEVVDIQAITNAP